MVGDGDGSSALTIWYDIGLGDWVTLTSTVFAGSDVVSTAVDVIVSVEGGSVIAGAVMVSVCSEVCIIVVTTGALADEDAAAEPPSTATTE